MSIKVYMNLIRNRMRCHNIIEQLGQRRVNGAFKHQLTNKPQV